MYIISFILVGGMVTLVMFDVGWLAVVRVKLVPILRISHVTWISGLCGENGLVRFSGYFYHKSSVRCVLPNWTHRSLVQSS